jgi:hypothetical protein
MAVSHSVEITAPVETVWRLLEASIENPGTLWPGAGAEVLERRPGSVQRRLTLAGVTVVERVTAFPARHAVDAVLDGDQPLAGQSKLRIEPPLRPGLACRLTISLDWRSTGGRPAPDLSAAVRGAALAARQAAESQA